jgi:hypothetical protein
MVVEGFDVSCRGLGKARDEDGGEVGSRVDSRGPDPIRRSFGRGGGVGTVGGGGFIVASSRTPMACKTLQTVKTSILSPTQRSEMKRRRREKMREWNSPATPPFPVILTPRSLHRFAVETRRSFSLTGPKGGSLSSSEGREERWRGEPGVRNWRMLRVKMMAAGLISRASTYCCRLFDFLKRS